MRNQIVLSLFGIVWLVLLGRIYLLSVQSNTKYDDLAHQNTIKMDYIAPIRGEILDRNKKPLAINKLGFKIRFKPHMTNEKTHEELNALIDVLLKQLPDLDREKIYKTYVQNDSPYNHQYIEVIDFIENEKILPVYSRLNLVEAIELVSTPKRYYPYMELGAHILGYVSKANKEDVEDNRVAKMVGSTGKSGIEKYYNEHLQGQTGHRKIKVSAYNEEVSELEYVKPIENRNIVLNVDIELEQYIKTLFGADTGVAIVMDKEGAILAAVSVPEYDLNTFVSGITPQRWNELITDINAPFTNKIINGLYPPGSVVKTGLGLIYITKGTINEWSTYSCTGTMELGNRNFRCWKHTGHDKTNITKAIRESCDDYFYKGSLNVGIQAMSDNLTRFGLGQKTGVDLPNEFIGTIPNKQWKMQKFNQPWFIGETLNTSIGQGDMLATPLQVTVFTALMATGKMPIPHIAREIGTQKYSPEPLDVLDEKEKKKLPIIRKAMRQVVSDPMGTAHNFINTRVQIAGKTGTAQVIGISQKTKKRLKEHELAYFKRSHAWLSSYGPYEDPEYIVTILVEHGGHGGNAAGPMTSRIYDWLYKNKYITKLQ
ncbi:MAG: penicillin-binding protein [Sulfuricurvum sp. PC08-66]|nr:MAG: penicillin-binding protein [Sulfuricurvum sp. PC08-66]